MSEGSGGPLFEYLYLSFLCKNSLSVVNVDTVCNSKMQNFTYTYPTSRLYVERKVRTNYIRLILHQFLFSRCLSFNFVTIVIIG